MLGIFKYIVLEEIYVLCSVYFIIYNMLLVLYFDYYELLDDICCKVYVGVCSVMIDGSYFLFVENVKLVKLVVDFCYLQDCSVEVELGCLGGVEDDMSVDVESVFLIDL